MLNTNKVIILLLCFVLAFSTIGCKGSKPDINEPEISSSDVSSLSSEEDISSSNEEPSDDFLENEEPSDDFLENEEEITEDEQYSKDDYNDDFLGLYDDIYIKNSTTPTCNEFLGLNGVYHAYTYIPDDLGRVYTEKQAKLVRDRVKQMGLNMVRTYYGSEYAWNAKTKIFDYNSDDMRGVYRWLKELEQDGIDVGINAGWNWKVYLKGDTWPVSPGIYVEGDREKSIENYTNWIIDSLNAMKANGCNNVKYLFMFTEPNLQGWYNETDLTMKEVLDPNKKNVITEYEEENMGYYDYITEYNNWFSLTSALDSEMEKAGIRGNYQFVGPNTHGSLHTADGTYIPPMFYKAVTEAQDQIDIYSSHFYMQIPDLYDSGVDDCAKNYWGDFLKFSKKYSNKPFWVDETNIRLLDKDSGSYGKIWDNAWGALRIAEFVTSGMNLGVDNMILWSIADQQWPNTTTYSEDNFVNGIQTTGVIPSAFYTSKPKVSYYGVSLLTKYLGNGKTYEAKSGFLFASAEEDKNGDYSILVVSTELDDIEITVNFEKEIGAKKVYRHLYNTSTQKVDARGTLIGIDKAIEVKDGSFVDVLPSASFAIYTTKNY